MAGHIQYPIIVGFLHHPNGVRLFSYHKDLLPQMNLTYNGVTWRVDEEGTFEVIHRGNPKVSYTKGGGLGAAAGAIGAALGVAGEEDPSAVPSNPALKPASEDVWVRMRFGAKGEWRLTDAVGQMIEMDHTKNRIYISNNDLKASQAGDDAGVLQISTNSTDAEYVLLDREKQLVLINARDIIQLYSFGRRKDVTDGSHSHRIGGDENISVAGDKKDKYDGDWEFSVGGDFKPSIAGNMNWDITGDLLVSTNGNTDIVAIGNMNLSSSEDLLIRADAGGFTAEGSGGASSLTLENGQIALKGSQGEVMDLIGQILQAILALTVPTSPGGGPSGPPINASDFSQLLSKFKAMAG